MGTTYTVGLTGGIGSGKSSVANCFAEYGIVIVDTDQIARDVVAPGQQVLNAIQEKFGADALLANGHLNRAFMRETTFSNPELKAWLNNTLHPLIRAKMLAQIDQSTSSYCIVDVPLLTENNMASMFDRILVVDCPEPLQLQRAMNRDNSDAAGIKNIIAAQASRSQRQTIADDIILNDGSIEKVKEEVNTLHKRYLLLSKMHQ